MLPLTIVVFGATGDLFKKKLTSAFFDVFQKGLLPKQITIVGLSRKNLSHTEFREFARSSIKNIENTIFLEEFLSKLFYYSIDATDADSLIDLRDILDKVDQSFGTCSNKLFYIATIPQTYENIFKNISSTGLSIPCIGNHKDNQAWIRIIVEKPFGTDEHNANRLDELLGKSFEENQIFRIDHYLAKEAVQNIYSFRFKNILFSPLWSSKYIEKVEIIATETQDVENRKSFYDSVGAIKDVGQNHLLELLSLLTMEEPESENAYDIRRQRAKVLSDVRVSNVHKKEFVFGQYDGYAHDEYANSSTETYFNIPLEILNERWMKTLFIIEHGKALQETKCEITIHFKKVNVGNVPNKINLKIQPESGICVYLGANEGFGETEKQMCFELGLHENQYIYPYEKLLLDAILGDQTLFVSTEEVKEEWRITTEIKNIALNEGIKIYNKGVKEIV